MFITWVWGESLLAILRDVRQGVSPRPSVPETIRLIRGLAHGLSHFHRQANLIHGDISPANILVTSGTKNLVLIDFGAAWPVEYSAGEKSGDGITPIYAAPERIARHAVEDFRSDTFSLAVVAYEMLTLEIPFDGAGGNILPQFAASFSGTYVPPSKRISQPDRLPKKALELLDELFRVGLGLHPDGRHATRKDWLSAWDELHFALQKGDRLTSFENRIVTWL